MEIYKEKQTPKRSLKRSLIVFIGNVLGIYLISFLGLGVTVNEFGNIIVEIIGSNLLQPHVGSIPRDELIGCGIHLE